MKNVTPIDMLPELEDLEGGSIGSGGKPNYSSVPGGGSYATVPGNFPGAQMIPNSEIERMARHVRNGHVLHPDSGMIPYKESEMMQQRPLYHPNTQMMNSYGTPIAPEVVETKNGLSASPTCLEVADHIANCPICSKFYNNDKTIYIIAIVLLAIVCILLLKRVLDV